MRGRLQQRVDGEKLKPPLSPILGIAKARAQPASKAQLGGMAPSDPQTEAERRPVSFPEWQHVLAAAPLPAAWRTVFVREILAFLHVCKTRRAPVSIALAREYLAAGTRRDPAVAREALRWFVRRGRYHPTAPTAPAGGPRQRTSPATQVQARAAGHGSSGGPEAKARPMLAADRRLRATEPPPAAQDLGGADWERDLIAALRRRGLLWRTEQTYRAWAARFGVRLSSGSGCSPRGKRRWIRQPGRVGGTTCLTAPSKTPCGRPRWPPVSPSV